MPNEEFLRAVQCRTARIAVSASATRGQGKGVVLAGREFFSGMSLTSVQTKSKRSFSAKLDQVTNEFNAALPRASQSWGLARKLVNIFLRDALYTSYLAEKHELEAIAPFLEIPLDSISGARLFNAATKKALPRWPGVKHLMPDISGKYQAVGSELAAAQQISPVHLDTFWWGQRAASHGV